MLSDKETDIDALGFEPYANSLSKLITQKVITPFTIGIFGSWGTGKTSLMLMIKKNLEFHPKVRTAWFDAWKFNDERQIWAALVQGILNQLDVSLEQNAKQKLKELKENVEWMRFLTFLGRSIISGRPDIDSLKESFSFGKKVESISEFEKKFEKFIDACNIERLIVFIDDLDRCKMNATLHILETIKLLLNSKKCVYVLGLDYQRVCDAVSHQFSNDSHQVAEAYLDKIIQLSFHIPRRTEEDMKIYLRYLHALEYLKEENVRQFAADMRRIGKNIDKEFIELLKNYTGIFSMDKYKALTEHDLLIIRENEFNPRKLKRFLNVYEMRESLSKVLELNLENEYLIKFLLLQIRFPEFYRDLENYPELLKEINKLIFLSDEKERKEKLSASNLLETHYSNSELLRFLKEVPFRDVDPSPYLRIAETAKPEIALGEKEKKIREDLMSEDSMKALQGLKNFEQSSEEQKEGIILDLLQKVESNDPQIRKESLQVFATLREVIPEDLIDHVREKVMERTKDENGEVRTQASWTLEGLREVWLFK